jgi:hypothetical protein
MSSLVGFCQCFVGRRLVRLSSPQFEAPASFTSSSDVNSPYSITSSARASRLSGTVIPSALAAFTLMINSNLVGA